MKIIFTIFFILTINQLFAQSKKEQIKLLNSQLDSLKILNELMQVNLIDQKEKLSLLSSQLDSLKILNDLKQDDLQNQAIKINQLNTELIWLKNKNSVLIDNDSILRLELLKSQQKHDSLVMNQKVISTCNTKHEILTNLVGEFKLESIEGVQGANTMFDYYIKNGQWFCFYSSLEDGMRDGSEEKLKVNDNKFLNSIKIEVFKDLSIKVFNGNKVLVEVPFIESGMDYKITKNESKLSAQFLELSPTTIFKDKNLMLLADDLIDPSIFFIGSPLEMLFSDNLILFYSLKDGEFVLEIFSSEFSESSTFTFKTDNQ